MTKFGAVILFALLIILRGSSNNLLIKLLFFKINRSIFNICQVRNPAIHSGNETNYLVTLRKLEKKWM